ncbi:hypothetical protein AB4876_09385 [Zhongshania guokunii]|uniref:Uncharacterized protein n=1 Tax=Zhongshania guokunii TaxID=641783 RepID=A0ABV3U590_9GAMM
MSGIFLNEDELEALDQVPAAARWLYIEILQRADYGDAVGGMPAVVVGRSKIITMNSLAKSLEYVPRRGSTRAPDIYGKGQIRHMLDQLKAAELIVKTTQSKYELVFRLPFAKAVR